MDLLKGCWIPVRPLSGGAPEAISLRQLLCGDDRWQLCLPRDDMELAALQLLVCLVQVTWMPEDDAALKRAVNRPLSEADFDEGIARWGDLFQLDHPETPCLQVKGVAAKEVTGMDKLMAGLTGATNCAFVNEPGQGEALCGGCAAIALFNQANNAPSFGGGFKSGLRGSAPVTTLVQAVNSARADLRTTVWLNVLPRNRVESLFGGALQLEQPPTWREPIRGGENIPAATIGLVRGLFWQPNHIELCEPTAGGQCSGCGQPALVRYDGFRKAKFNFTVEGTWPHPHSPLLKEVKKGQLQNKFLAFTTPAPSWTQLSRLVVSAYDDKGGGHEPAAVVSACADIFRHGKTHLIVGGYRNNQASILERRHEVMTLNPGWQQHPEVIQAVVDIGLKYKTALRKSLYTFVEGLKAAEIKGAGVAVHEVAERDYYRQSDLIISELLACMDFDHADPALERLRADLHRLCERLFDSVTRPYSHHPKLVRVMAFARRSLHKHLSDLKLTQGGQHVA
jgi:CRISPR system Cascade subunit CasA